MVLKASFQVALQIILTKAVAYLLQAERNWFFVQFSLISQKLLMLLTILCCCGSLNIIMAFEGSHYNFLKIIYIGENNIQ